MTHTVVIPNKIVAKDIDAWVRPARSASAIDNGMVFNLLSKTSGSGYEEVWAVTQPTTGSLSGVWMALEPELPMLVSGTKVYNGIGTIQDFYTSASTVFTAVKPQVGDIITVTSDAFVSGTAPTAGQYAVVVADSWLLTAQATTGVGQSWKFLGTQNIPLADGTIGSQRITGYQLECVIA